MKIPHLPLFNENTSYLCMHHHSSEHIILGAMLWVKVAFRLKHWVELVTLVVKYIITYGLETNLDAHNNQDSNDKNERKE